MGRHRNEGGRRAGLVTMFRRPGSAGPGTGAAPPARYDGYRLGLSCRPRPMNREKRRGRGRMAARTTGRGMSVSAGAFGPKAAAFACRPMGGGAAWRRPITNRARVCETLEIPVASG